MTVASAAAPTTPEAMIRRMLGQRERRSRAGVSGAESVFIAAGMFESRPNMPRATRRTQQKGLISQRKIRPATSGMLTFL